MRLHLVIDGALSLAERLQLAVAIVNDADGGGESEFDGALADDQGVVRIVNAAADHGVDVDVKVGVLGQHLQLLVEHLEALLRHVVGHDVVDRDLQVIEPGVVQALDALRHQQVAVGDHAGDHAAAGGCAR